MPRTFRLHQKVERRAVKSTVRRPCHERSQPSAIILLLGERELRRYDLTRPGHAVLMLGATARLRGSAVVGACRPHWVLVAGIRSPGSLLFALLCDGSGHSLGTTDPLRLEWPLGPAGRGCHPPTGGRRRAVRRRALTER